MKRSGQSVHTIAFAVLLLAGCNAAVVAVAAGGVGAAVTGGKGSKGGSGSTSGAPLPARISPSAKLVDPLVPSAVIVAANKLTFTGNSAAQAMNYQPGDILVSDNGYGFLRKVTSVTTQGNDVVVSTTQAALTDAVVQGSIRQSQKFEIASAVALPVTAGGTVTLPVTGTTVLPNNKGTITQRAGGLDLSQIVIYDDGLGTSIKIPQGHVAFEPKLDLKLDIFGSDVQFRAVASGTVSMGADVLVEIAKAQTSKAGEVELIKMEHVFVQFIGWLPVVEVVRLRFKAGFELEATSGISIAGGGSLKFTLELGGEWKNNIGWVPVDLIPTNELQFTPLQVSSAFGATAKIYVRPELDILFYYVAGPGFDLEPYLKAEVYAQQQPLWKLYLGVDGHFRFVASDFLQLAPYRAKVLNWSTLVAEAPGSTPGSAPLPPTGLTATAVSANQIDLSWADNSNNEDGFKIERKNGAGIFSPLAPVPANTRTYSDSNLAAATRYTYRVCSYNAIAPSTPSNEASDTTFTGGLTLIGNNRYRNDRDRSVLAKLPGGTFLMGDGAGFGIPEELPVHSVTVSPFYIGENEVTWKQWKGYVAANPGAWNPAPSYQVTDSHPVHNVSWDDVQGYLNWAGLRLPTEAEWEYAARASLRDSSYSPVYATSTGGFTNNLGNSRGINGLDVFEYSSPVGSFSSNGFGLFDMSGNLWEWCSDRYGSYAASPSTDPTGPSSGTTRVIRGGSWADVFIAGVGAGALRCATRIDLPPSGRSFITTGFRVARSQ